MLTAIGLPRLKPLKPPGSKPAAAPKPRQPISAEAKAAQAALKAEKALQQVTPGAAPTLRHSTRVRVEEAEQVRQRAEKVTSLTCPDLDLCAMACLSLNGCAAGMLMSNSYRLMHAEMAGLACISAFNKSLTLRLGIT